MLVVTVSIAGLLVMVSSELVVLLIVCVGINTGSAQGELTCTKEQLCTGNFPSVVSMHTCTIVLAVHIDCVHVLNFSDNRLEISCM